MAGVGLCEFVQRWSGIQPIGTRRRDAGCCPVSLRL